MTHFEAYNYTLIVLGSMQKRGTFPRSRRFLRSHAYIFSRISCQGLKGVLGPQGSGLKKCRAPGLQDDNFRAPGLHIICFWAPGSTMVYNLEIKKLFCNAKSSPQIKTSALPTSFLNPRSRLSCLQLFKSGLKIKLE